MAESQHPPPEELVLYHKNPKTEIATITLNRPDRLNAPTAAARLRFSDLIRRADVDDEVKVLIIRGAGDHFGSGADLPEQAAMHSSAKTSVLHEFRIGEDAAVKYPPGDSYRYLASLTQLYANSNFGMRSLQDFKKISILEVKGYCYGWHFYLAGDADLVIASEEALFGHPSFRYAGWGPRMWTWATMMGLRKFQEMVFTGRPFTAREMYECSFVNSVVPRGELEVEVQKYARACAITRPTDTVMMQKTFFEVFKQKHGEYMGSVLTGWLESMLPLVKSEGEFELGEVSFGRGLNNSVKDYDKLYPAEWRLSYGGRKEAPPGGEMDQLRQQLAELQVRISALQANLSG